MVKPVLKTPQTLLSRHRFHPQPPTPGIFPYTYHWSQQASTTTSESRQPPSVRHLTFSKPSPTGEFTDFTARYGALQEEDKDTLFQLFRESLYPSPTEEAIHAVSSTLGIQHILGLPVVALSSGQTRRSRIAAGLLARPRMLILEDPFAGLDVQSRAQIADMLGAVNSGKTGLLTGGSGDTMRLVLSLRGTGAVGMPAYVTHVARVMGGEVKTLPKDEYVDEMAGKEKRHVVPELAGTSRPPSKPSKPLVDVQDVSIAYGEEKVSLPHTRSRPFTEPGARCSTAYPGASFPVTDGTSKAPTAAGKRRSFRSSSATTRDRSPSLPNG